MIIYHILIIITVNFVTFGLGQDFPYFSNFKFGPLEWGKESMIKDFATLTTDKVGNLPDSFTICSSNFITFVSSSSSVFQLLKQDGSPWFKLSIETGQRNRVTFTEVLKLWLPPGGSYTSYHQDQCRKSIHRFHNRLNNHGEGPYQGLLLVESAYQRFHI